MSAIAGIYCSHGELIASAEGQNMMNALQRRYPADRVGTWQKEDVFLGCHMQWVTPESLAEVLPYYDQVSQTAITADAIIDNRSELFERLQIHREDRRIIPDSLLILLAYHQWGYEAPKYLIGDFAFMIWDERKQQLFGARDFSGSRALYYHYNSGVFAFCTVMNPLLALPGVKKQLNDVWLAEFLTIPGMNDAVDTQSTVYQTIEQVPPSHSVLVDERGIRFSRYLTLSPERLKLSSDQEYIEAFREVFQEAVQARVRTHRQVGSFLSGGLDSGAVVGFASRILRCENKPLHTFSSIPAESFTDWTPSHRIADERPLIRETVKYVGNIKDAYFDFDGRDPLSEVDELLTMMEMPYKFFENSVWHKGIYEQAQQADIGVILSGSRGNMTISWGPALDYMALLLKRNWLRYLKELHLYSRKMGARRKRVITVTSQKSFPYISRMIWKEVKPPFPMLVNPELARKTGTFEKLNEYGLDITGSKGIRAIQARTMHFDQLHTWNTSNVTNTKLSLPYAVMERDPTNDLRVVRFCLSLPMEQFVRDGTDRRLVRRGCEGYLPDQVRLNQRIRGIQGSDWIHRMIPLWPMFLAELDELSKDEAIFEYLNKPVVMSAIAKAQKGPNPEHAFDPDYRLLMRSIIVHRFIKSYL